MPNIDIKPLNIKWSDKGLIPCIVQEDSTNEVLMLAYMNEEALRLSLKTHIMHYFSRSKNRIWKKGETSGHIQKIHSLVLDCDNDTILARVSQSGVACHTGNKTCFFKENIIANITKTSALESNIDSKEILQDKEAQNIESKDFTTNNELKNIIDSLYRILLTRKNSSVDLSYTARLYNKGINEICKKIIEESGELIIALKDGTDSQKNRSQIIYECADVVYHILVALSFENINLDEIRSELKRRFNISGIDEKNARNIYKDS